MADCSRLSFPFSLLAAAFLLGVPSGCAWQGRMSTLDPKGPVAQVQFDLFMVTVWVSLFLFVTVGGAFFYAVWRFREKPGQKTQHIAEQLHGNPLIEIGLIAASIFMLVIIAVPTVQAIWYTHDLPEHPESRLQAWYSGQHLSEGEGDKYLTIRAEGYQWWWAFRYPQLGVTTGNEFVMPAGKVIRIELRGMDVIHSFWLPKIAGKVDLIPGRANWMWIQAGDSYEEWIARSGFDGPEDAGRLAYQEYLESEIYGTYYGQCAEFCGESHAYMLFRAHVVPDDEFEAWVERKNTPAPAPDGSDDWDGWFDRAFDDSQALLEIDPIQHGAYLYHTKGACIQCHRIEGSPSSRGALGPDLTKIGARTTLGAGWMENRGEDGNIDRERQLANLTRWIYESHKIKPGNLMYHGASALEHVLHPSDPNVDPLTREEVERISAWLQTLR